MHQLGLSNKLVSEINCISNISHGSHVSEIFSPPRVTALANKFKLTPGFALDLSQDDPEDGKPWDFNNSAKRAKAIKLIKEDKPFILIASPPCTPFSIMFRSNASRMDPERRKRALQEGINHLNFCCNLYTLQDSEGRYFLHEHPQSASSWQSTASNVCVH